MWVRVAAVIVCILLPTALHAQEKRIALLIGNKDYKAGVGALTNPLNDIRIVSDALKAVGFELLKPVENAQRTAMLLAVHAFATRLKAAGPDAVGFLYYSGHGIASEGENYLIPTDVDEPSTLLIRVQGVKHSEVLAILRKEAPNAAHYVVSSSLSSASIHTTRSLCILVTIVGEQCCAVSLSWVSLASIRTRCSASTMARIWVKKQTRLRPLS